MLLWWCRQNPMSLFSAQCIESTDNKCGCEFEWANGCMLYMYIYVWIAAAWIKMKNNEESFLLTVIAWDLLICDRVLWMIAISILSGVHHLFLIFQRQCQIHWVFECFVLQTAGRVVRWWCLILLCHNWRSYGIHFVVFDLSTLFALVTLATAEHQHQANE